MRALGGKQLRLPGRSYKMIHEEIDNREPKGRVEVFQADEDKEVRA